MVCGDETRTPMPLRRIRRSLVAVAMALPLLALAPHGPRHRPSPGFGEGRHGRRPVDSGLSYGSSRRRAPHSGPDGFSLRLRGARLGAHRGRGGHRRRCRRQGRRCQGPRCQGRGRTRRRRGKRRRRRRRSPPPAASGPAASPGHSWPPSSSNSPPSTGCAVGLRRGPSARAGHRDGNDDNAHTLRSLLTQTSGLADFTADTKGRVPTDPARGRSSRSHPLPRGAGPLLVLQHQLRTARRGRPAGGRASACAPRPPSTVAVCSPTV